MQLNKVGKFSTQIIILLILLVIISMFSAYDHARDIEDRMLCHAMGVDYKNGEYDVSLQVFKPSGAGSDTPVDTTQSNVTVIYGHGKTISEAFEQCENESGKEVFLGHLQIICFGKNMDFSSPERLFDFCLKDKNVYLGVYLCMSEENAKEVIETKMTTGTMSAENFVQIIENNVIKGQTIECRLINFLSSINGKQFIAMPVISVKKPEEKNSQSSGGGQSQQGGGEQSQQQEEDPILQIKETAIIKEGKVLSDTIPTEEVTAISILQDQTKEINLAVMHRGQMQSVRVTRDSKKIWLTNENGRAVYNVKLELVAHSVKDIVSPQESSELSAEVTKEFDQRFYDAHCLCIEQNKADVFRIWKLIRMKYPKTYLEYEDNLDVIYENMGYNFVVGCKVE